MEAICEQRSDVCYSSNWLIVLVCLGLMEMHLISRWDPMELFMQLSLGMLVQVFVKLNNSYNLDKPSPLLAVRKNDFSVKWCVGAGILSSVQFDLFFAEGEDPLEPLPLNRISSKKKVKCVGVDKDSGAVFAYFGSDLELKKVFLYIVDIFSAPFLLM